MQCFKLWLQSASHYSQLLPVFDIEENCGQMTLMRQNCRPQFKTLVLR